MTGPKGNSEFSVFFPETLNGLRSTKSFALLRLPQSQFCRGFREHDLITCESKVYVVVSLGS